jgi:autotransporter-associated beta strand protein
VSAGTLRVLGGAALSDGTTVAINAATLDLAGSVERIGQLGTMANGQITAQPGGRLALANADSAATITGASSVAADLQLNTGAAATRTFAVTGAGDSLAISGVISEGDAPASLTKTGAGTLTLQAASTYTGVTAINGGTLSVTGSIASSAVTVGNTGVLSGTGTVGSITAGAGGDDLARRQRGHPHRDGRFVAGHRTLGDGTRKGRAHPSRRQRLRPTGR